MSRKIAISKQELQHFYEENKQSTYQIARKFNCDPSVIQKRIKKYGLVMRYPKKRIDLSRDILMDLYVNKKLSVSDTAKKLGISHCSTYYKLIQAGVQPRKKNLLLVSKNELFGLYVKKRLSASEIARQLNSNTATVIEKIEKYGIKKRSVSETSTLYKKRRFNGTNELKAYMIGFRLGDLYVRAADEESTVMISSNTTKNEQLQLIKNIFGIYGHFKCKTYGDVHHVYCNLHKSFNFLIKKEDKIGHWILKSKSCFLAFLGGYSDAEGNFGVYQGRARYRIGSYDKNIVKQIREYLVLLGINAKFRLEIKADKRKNQNHDFYRTSINDKESLLKFIFLIKPYTKHGKRHRDLLRCEKNILERNKKRSKA